MNPFGIPWTALFCVQPEKSHQLAWFAYGWIQREQILNVTAYADWWMRAIGLPAAQPSSPLKELAIQASSFETQALKQARDPSDLNRYRSPTPVEAPS